MIRLSVPGTLAYRDVAVRMVGSAARVLRAEAQRGSSEEIRIEGDLSDEFTSQLVSAFSEAFNNVVIHGYQRAPHKRIDIEARLVPSTIELDLVDEGKPFDPSGYQKLPDSLPEGGMGLFIMRSFVDEIRYVSGPPNTLTLVKRF
jgi:serine/threonine-protein kinase RsbW